MNLTLTRTEFGKDGIFGVLTDENGKQVAVTLEHAFEENGIPTPKVDAGVYECIRHAPNRLPYETFELQHVPAFNGKPVTGILLHVGNFNEDSDGCILLGRRVLPRGLNTIARMVTSSKNTFNAFMDLQSKTNTFTLTIKERTL